jgi:hypothetical protein
MIKSSWKIKCSLLGKHVMSKICTAVALGALSTLPFRIALADPRPEILRLMHEPVSMLDRGLDQLQNDLRADLDYEPTRTYAGLPEAPSVTAEYDRPSDRIVVSVGYVNERQDADAVCRKTITFLRNKLDPRWPNGKRRGESHLWLIDFMHTGAGNAEHTPAWKSLETIPDLVTLKVSVPSNRLAVNCSGRLTGDSVTFEK